MYLFILRCKGNDKSVSNKMLHIFLSSQAENSISNLLNMCFEMELMGLMGLVGLVGLVGLMGLVGLVGNSSPLPKAHSAHHAHQAHQTHHPPLFLFPS